MVVSNKANKRRLDSGATVECVVPTLPHLPRDKEFFDQLCDPVLTLIAAAHGR